MIAAEICFDCMRVHMPPPCGWNPDLQCAGCGQPRGFRYSDDQNEAATPTGLCWRCGQPELFS